ncbi:polysaccharide deacetylase family protein [Desulfoferrobacter suflitae]|uniref:polysaccharide deacetylase family protein n=1 Tax=Desulfoferrobacter suflitae TaxID=2865782 RepID=UPI002164E6DB|nr:polysaccharide deacetylase family protein [Desulfoferrobacter suflitae]MCK8603448.1 polysaccharide deacetylase family protein [Desulfoferrobacter suflitae]
MKHDSSPTPQDLKLPEHYRPRHYAAVWRSPLHGWRERLTQIIEQTSASHTAEVFFRADDIGAGGRAFEALCHMFRRHAVPLGMSVVPAWLSTIREQQLFASAPVEEPLWGWHQHGWRHVNWQRSGKKSEFGDHRPFEKQWRDIWQGRQKMVSIFGEHFLPVFTPPWNRLSGCTLKILQQLDFRAVSLSKPFPKGHKNPLGLNNLKVPLDLHTRKSKDAAKDFDELLAQLTTLLGRKEPVGIMIHHQRMTTFAYQFLDALLQLLNGAEHITVLGLQELLDRGNE